MTAKKEWVYEVTMRDWIGKPDPYGFGKFTWRTESELAAIEFVEQCKRFGQRVKLLPRR